jgi:hypothetical protein
LAYSAVEAYMDLHGVRHLTLLSEGVVVLFEDLSLDPPVNRGSISRPVTT